MKHDCVFFPCGKYNSLMAYKTHTKVNVGGCVFFCMSLFTEN
jgi:hypothetical protein